jgi:hypothetical protein
MPIQCFYSSKSRGFCDIYSKEAKSERKPYRLKDHSCVKFPGVYIRYDVGHG